MMKRYLFLLMLLALLPTPSHATTLWSTTYTCGSPDFVYAGEYLPGMSGSGVSDPYCTDMADYGQNWGWGTSNAGDSANCPDSGGTHYSTITASASRTSGSKGSRQYLGGSDGNQYSEGPAINFPATGNFNFRWYERYGAGFSFNNAIHKDIYFMYQDGNNSFWIIPEPHGTEYIVGVSSDPSEGNISTTLPLATAFDGNWHCYELHWDSGNVSMWFDGTQVLNHNYAFGSHTISHATIGSNNEEMPIGNRTCIPVDFDDIAISNGTYIGLAGGGGDTTPPTVTAFTIPSTSSSLTVSITSYTATDDTAVTGYCVNESPSAPTSASCSGSGWAGTAETSYTFASSGSKTLYAWAKDAAGNISSSRNDSVTISLPSTVVYLSIKR